MNWIDKLYIINLDQRVDRLEETIKVISQLDIDTGKVERISAIEEKKGALGCSKSHCLALETFIQSGLSYALILEDDFTYFDRTQILNVMNKIHHEQVDFDVIQIAYNNTGLFYATPTKWENLQKVGRAGTTSAYIISQSFAPILLENMKDGVRLLETHIASYGEINYHYCIDVYWCKLQPDSKWYCTVPRLGYQRESYSDIEKRITNYGV